MLVLGIKISWPFVILGTFLESKVFFKKKIISLIKVGLQHSSNKKSSERFY